MFKYIIVTGSLLCSVCYDIAEIPLNQLKGLGTCVHEPYKQLSPAYGALYKYSPFLTNVYKYGPQSSAFVKFIKDIFYLRENAILHNTDS